MCMCCVTDNGGRDDDELIMMVQFDLYLKLFRPFCSSHFVSYLLTCTRPSWQLCIIVSYPFNCIRLFVQASLVILID